MRVYSAKFLTQGQADRLAGVVCSFVSDYQAETIRHDAFLTDRVKTSNRAVLNSIGKINEAMSKELEGQKHEPEKITFKYLKYSIKDVTQQVERRKGETYKVSPFKLLINDGNYYLLAYDEDTKDVKEMNERRLIVVRICDNIYIEYERKAVRSMFSKVARVAPQVVSVSETTYEIARDEARHGRAFEGLLKRYFG